VGGLWGSCGCPQIRRGHDVGVSCDWSMPPQRLHLVTNVRVRQISYLELSQKGEIWGVNIWGGVLLGVLGATLEWNMFNI
jgi:hypothetical protein